MGRYDWCTKKKIILVKLQYSVINTSIYIRNKKIKNVIVKNYFFSFFPDIYNISGYYDNYLKYGDIFSYQNTARAKIFNRDAGNVKNMDDMIRMMRFQNSLTTKAFSFLF